MSDSAQIRYGFVGILVENRSRSAAPVQETLSRFGHIIRGRMGLPNIDDSELSIITLIVRADPDEIGALTGRLEGVSVKSAMAKQ